jgi:hypothetical protein
MFKRKMSGQPQSGNRQENLKAVKSAFGMHFGSNGPRASQSGDTLEAWVQQLQAMPFHWPIPKVKLYCPFN